MKITVKAMYKLLLGIEHLMTGAQLLPIEDDRNVLDALDVALREWYTAAEAACKAIAEV